MRVFIVKGFRVKLDKRRKIGHLASIQKGTIMIKILFICHGNICRSPMAEYVMKDMVEKAGLAQHFEIASAATSTEEIGCGVYPPARQKLAQHGISCKGHAARQVRRSTTSTTTISSAWIATTCATLHASSPATPKVRSPVC